MAKSKSTLVIDSISLLSSLTGIGRYTHEIAKAIEHRNLYTTEYFYGYYSKTLIHPNTNSEMKGLKALVASHPLIKKMARKLLMLSSRLFAKSYDLYWQPNFIPNDGIKANKIVTSVHDFSFEHYKKFHRAETIEYFARYFYTRIHKSDHIITGSEFTKQEIIDRLNVSSDKIRVIYHGIDHEIFREEISVPPACELPDKFILSVGSIEPRKNLIGLLHAYTQLDARLRQEYKLILVGFQGWENREIMNFIQQHKEDIHYLGFVNDKELAHIYHQATCFVYPSFYEGFGLPVLEAMACGTPVICSNTTSLPEVGGDAVIYCNPQDINDIQAKIECLLRDPVSQQKMMQKGLQRAKMFSWEKSAEAHLQLFREVLQR